MPPLVPIGASQQIAGPTDASSDVASVTSWEDVEQLLADVLEAVQKDLVKVVLQNIQLVTFLYQHLLPANRVCRR